MSFVLMATAMIGAAAKLIPLSLPKKGRHLTTFVEVPKNMVSSGFWTKEQLKLAFHLYCQLPFGKLHSLNPEIIELATLIGRSSGSVAMKLVNFASLDPAITSTGRKGLGNASALDREVWGEFHSDWESLAIESSLLTQQLRAQHKQPDAVVLDESEQEGLDDFTGETRQIVATQRIKEHFFRCAILSSYRSRCCMSGLSEPRLLVASHIVPWSVDRANRLNPCNGLCLSAIHDKAFDRGLITVSEDFKILVSEELMRRDEPFVKKLFAPLRKKRIELPERFFPDTVFLARHRKEVFVDK